MVQKLKGNLDSTLILFRKIYARFYLFEYFINQSIAKGIDNRMKRF